MSEKERVELNSQAARLMRSLGYFTDVGDDVYDALRWHHHYAGYAHIYLQGQYDNTELVNKADVTIYKRLVEIDAKLGTTQAQQLHGCVFNTLRMDLIKV